MMDLRVLDRPLDLYVEGRGKATGAVTLRRHVDGRHCRRVESTRVNVAVRLWRVRHDTARLRWERFV